ncbi:MAG: spheroidene monooxygenase [Candidatus Planktophila sp.]
MPFAFSQMAWGRRTARRIPGVTFAKLMGTGTGRTFTPSDADLQKWAILFVAEDLEIVEQSTFIKRWRRRSLEVDKYILKPISSHGKWSKREPFELSGAKHGGGPVVAITRARLKWSQSLRFWRSIPPVVNDLHQSPGLLFSFGIGEAPIGLQGTFSLWESAQSLREFAYKNAPHRAAIADTEKFNWYSEELFARFDLVNTADFNHVH